MHRSPNDHVEIKLHFVTFFVQSAT